MKLYCKVLKAKKTKTTSIAFTWSKVSGAEFYEIYSGDNKLLGTSKTNSFTVKKLKAGTGYDFKNDPVKIEVKGADEVKAVKDGLESGKAGYARVRAYATYGGTTVYGAWSKVKAVK